MKRTNNNQSKQFEWQVTTKRIRTKKQSHIVPKDLVVNRMSLIPTDARDFVPFTNLPFTNYPSEI